MATFTPKRTPWLPAGRLRQKISIVVISPTQDSAGGQNLSLTVVYANVWAAVEGLTGEDKFAAHEFVSEVSHQITIRFIGAAPSWLSRTNYIGNALVKDSNGNLQQAQSGGGTSGATAPAWNPTINGLTQDGSMSTGVVWKNLGPASMKTGINAGMQVQCNGHQYQVKAVVNPDGRNKLLCLMCVEINDTNQQFPQTGTQGSFPAPTPVSDIDGGTF